MPVYLLTLHAYRSWRPDHPKGYVRQGEGILPPDAEMAAQYDRNATHRQVTFDKELQQILVEGTCDICDRRDWRLHYVATEPTHIHALVSWLDDTLDWKFVHDTLKRLLGMMLAQHTRTKGRKWFVRKGSRKRVRDCGHFEYLMNEYLPKHSGRRWSERAADCARSQ
ncbi:MAG: hypothetical protein ACE10B_09710 [Phycisphaerales bacterium]